ncbi:MAG TPA: tRNA pseudouridine(55) synthase TruB [Gammaproteobacteria bacterium]|nr:tRNA pseudouridine(55) synthase TruB [Gammaproteobacteria bacterium]
MINPAREARPPRRDVDGILLLDKPTGLTSNRALQKVKWLFAAKKAGHTGSLDPLATGLLPICFGEATKVSSFLLDADKGYRVRCQLGAATATGDADGEVTATAPVPALTEAVVEAALARFRGPISQTPPMYSALKHQGKRLYALAREGIEVERKPREVEIYALRLTAIDGNAIEFDVRCSKGTYVRTLGEDIARALGTVGHVTALHRYKVGAFDEAGALTLDELEQRASSGELDAALTPIDDALAHWPAVELNADMGWYLRRGQAVFVAGAPSSGWIRIYGPDRTFLGLGAVDSSGKVAPKRLIRTK